MSDKPPTLFHHIADATNTDTDADTDADTIERVLTALAIRASFGGTPLPRELTAHILNMTPDQVGPSTVIARSPELQQCLEDLVHELGIRQEERDDARYELQRAAYLHHAYTCDDLRGILNDYEYRIDTTPAAAIRDHGIHALRTLLDATSQPDDL